MYVNTVLAKTCGIFFHEKADGEKESGFRWDIRTWLLTGPEPGDSLALLNHSSSLALNEQ